MSRLAQFDPITLIERAYEQSGDPALWMRSMAGRLTESLDPERLGTLTYLLTERGPRLPSWTARGGEEISEGALQGYVEGTYGRIDERQRQRVFQFIRRPGVAVLHETLPDQAGLAKMLDGIREIPGLEGAQDGIALGVEAATSEWPMFLTTSTQRIAIDEKARRMWRLLSVHLGAAFRLAALEGGPEATDVESVLTPDGETVHASGAGTSTNNQELLREAARRVEEARTQEGRADPLLALETWSGLFYGRWSIVEHFDTDGKRFLLARRNDPKLGSNSVPSLRQRQVLYYGSLGWSNQEIAYSLGIAENTVSAHIKAGLIKIGVGSRAELISLTTPLVGPDDVWDESAETLEAFD